MYRRFLSNNTTLKFRRKELRNNATLAERLLWEQISSSQLGYKFRRQYSFGSYILDFYCPSKRLGIEVDGEIHKTQIEQDAYRDRTLGDYGISIIRFSNDEVVNEIDVVIQKIIAKLQ